MFISISWPSLVTSWVVIQKIYSKMYLVSCTNTHCDSTDSLNHGMVKNAKTWISWEHNIIFLRNKTILNLCLRWQILRSYCFVAEVIFNDEKNCYKYYNKWITIFGFVELVVIIFTLNTRCDYVIPYKIKYYLKKKNLLFDLNI